MHCDPLDGTKGLILQQLPQDRFIYDIVYRVEHGTREYQDQLDKLRIKTQNFAKRNKLDLKKPRETYHCKDHNNQGGFGFTGRTVAV